MARLFPVMDELDRKLRSTKIQLEMPVIEIDAVNEDDINELNNDRAQFEVRVHNLEHGEAYYPGFKKDLHIKTDTTYGRQIRTNENILIGEIALIEPFATVVLNVDINEDEIREPYCLTCHH